MTIAWGPRVGVGHLGRGHARRDHPGRRPGGGGARYAHEITVQYAKDRHQFDKPLGAFQALAHYLADGVTSVDGAEVLVHEAAWASASGGDIASWLRWPSCSPATPTAR